MQGRARDLVTVANGRAIEVGTARIDAEVEGLTRELRSLTTVPEVPTLQGLLGAVVGPGFRARVDELVPEERDERSLLYLLLDDLPGAGLVSGYALLRTDSVGRPTSDEYLVASADLCAGWASGGSMMQLIREHGQPPTPFGPPAPRLERGDDPLAWHDLAPLPPHSMRRLRRVDATAPTGGAEPDGAIADVSAFLRDSHFAPSTGAGDGESVVHEYSVDARVDVVERTILAIEARPDVLPWQECPAAIASAQRLVGHGLDDLRAHVRATFVGTTTCTHLNDVLRGLTDVDVLLDLVVGQRPEGEPVTPVR